MNAFSDGATGDSLVWVRSLLSVYRQVAVDVTGEGVDPAARRRVMEEWERVHQLFTDHEALGLLWREGFGGSEVGVRAALAPLVDSALACAPGSPLPALAGFAAEEIAFLFEEE
jgi:hypothetical protein